MTWAQNKDYGLYTSNIITFIMCINITIIVKVIEDKFS